MVMILVARAVAAILVAAKIAEVAKAEVLAAVTTEMAEARMLLTPLISSDSACLRVPIVQSINSCQVAACSRDCRTC